jgi:hypothetical protein
MTDSRNREQIEHTVTRSRQRHCRNLHASIFSGIFCIILGGSYASDDSCHAIRDTWMPLSMNPVSSIIGDEPDPSHDKDGEKVTFGLIFRVLLYLRIFRPSMNVFSRMPLSRGPVMELHSYNPTI